MSPLPHLITAVWSVEHGGSGAERQGEGAGAGDPSSLLSLQKDAKRIKEVIIASGALQL